MKSYLLLWFNSEGAAPMEVTRRLLGLGFKPVKGNYDYVYDWSQKTSTDEALNLANKVHATLKGCNVSFKLETE
jgi:hypothetical protein